MLFSTTAYGENIDPLNDDSQYAYGENIGWLNFEPLGDGGPGVQVEDTTLTGYVWAENIGWVSLSCENTLTCATVDYKVTNDGMGNLSGYAWGENVGWINFFPTYGGVTIDTHGDFHGWAWGENVGWVHFNSTSPVAYKVQTAWTPLVMGDLDCDDVFTGTDVLIQASLIVDLIDCVDLPCVSSCAQARATCDWDCDDLLTGTDVLFGASIIVDIITEADTPLGQWCPQ
jgi:hypothetical protein